MNFVDIMKDILQYAPTFALLFISNDAAKALSLLAEIFNVLDGDNNALHQAISTDPERAEKLCKLEENYKNGNCV